MLSILKANGSLDLSMTLTLDNKPIVVPDAIRRKPAFAAASALKFKVSGRAITIVPKESAEGDYTMETVMRIIKEAKEHPMSRRQGAALDASLMAYGAMQATKVGIKERDIPRVIHESRARRRTA